MSLQAVALDAMGVIYPTGDDLRDLLIPYLRARGCVAPDDELVRLFRACYRDGRPARELWEGTGCDWSDGALERDFLALYELRAGVIEFLEAMREAGVPVYGLSNDVAEWAITRRRSLGIDSYFADWLISGEAGIYKPDPAIFARFTDLLPCAPENCVFVDDSDRNVVAAREAGLQAVRFVPDAPSEGQVESFAALRELVLALL